MTAVAVSMPGNVELSTPRLILRPWRMEDAETLYSLASDPEIGTTAGWKPHSSVEESRNIISTVFTEPDVFAIVLRTSNTPIGCVGLNHDPRVLRKGKNDAEIGYWVGRRYWGQGFATEAVREIIRYAFEDLAITKIWCQSSEDNMRSANVQDKCGFKFDHMGLFENPYLGEVVTAVSSLSRRDWIRHLNN